jgi:hypothetical protein
MTSDCSCSDGMYWQGFVCTPETAIWCAKQRLAYAQKSVSCLHARVEKVELSTPYYVNCPDCGLMVEVSNE